MDQGYRRGVWGRRIGGGWVVEAYLGQIGWERGMSGGRAGDEGGTDGWARNES